MTKADKVVNHDLTAPFPRAASAKGVWITGQDGRRYMDGCAGALVANCGHGVPKLARAVAEQARTLDYVFRFHFTSPVAESLAGRYCNLTTPAMGRVYFTNSGSEAVEMAVKLARARHSACGEGGRQTIISRWQGYHGITMGAMAWSGITARRAEYRPYLREGVHIPPAYCYRCWFGRTPKNCGLECAHALEAAITTQGPETVSAFLAEPVSGAGLGAACPPPEYFRIIRDICDRYGVLYIADEVMCGAGRTGGTFFASDHFPGRPDIICFGKGAGAGCYPLAGAMVSRDTAAALASEGGGEFGAAQSYAAHPAGMAVGHAVLDYMEDHALPARAAKTGMRLGRGLRALLRHPMVGDVRGRGMIWGLEFVRDKDSRATFDPGLSVFRRVYHAARDEGLLVLPSSGCDRGRTGDLALIGPPLTITAEEVDELCARLDAALSRVERDLKMPWGGPG